MSETLPQHVVLSDGEYDALTKRLALAESVVEAARMYVHPTNSTSMAELIRQFDDIEDAVEAYDRSAAQEREGGDQ